MIKKIILLVLNCAPIATFLGILAFSLLFWYGRYSILISPGHEDGFSANTVSGVHVSREIDRRPLGGRVSGSNSYADFLTQATGLISSKNGGPVFSDDRFPRDIQNLIDRGHGIFRSPMIPSSSGEFLFGIQRVTRFKLIEMEENFANFGNLWVYLRSSNEKSKLAWIEGIDDSGVASVSGDIPPDFFPTEIEVVQNQDSTKVFPMLIVLNEVNVVSGGVISLPGKDRLVLRSVPYLSKIPFAPGRHQLPRLGDTIKFNNGEERKIVDVTSVGDSFIARVSYPISPYLTTNENVVSIYPKEKTGPYLRKIKISNRCDSNFILGRERYIKIKSSVGVTRVKDEFYISGCTEPFVFQSSSAGEISIDLRESIIRATANNAFNVKAINVDQFQMGAEKDSSPLGKIENSSVKKQEQRLISDWIDNLGDDSDVTKLRKFIREENWGWRDLCKEEMFSKSFNFNLYFKVDQTIKYPKSKPVVFGGGEIWEIYPGSMLNLFYGSENKADPELMIHALGSKLANKYYDRFEDLKPTFIGLAKPRQFTGWLIQWHWPFFEKMVTNYKEYYSNPDFSIWYRDHPEWRIPQGWQPLTPIRKGERGILLAQNNSSELSAYTIKLDYSVVNKFAKFPMIGASPRALLSIKNNGAEFPGFPQISLPLKDKSFSFPLFVVGNTIPEIEVVLEDPMHLGLKFELGNIWFRKVDANPQEIRNLILYTPEMRLLADF